MIIQQKLLKLIYLLAIFIHVILLLLILVRMNFNKSFKITTMFISSKNITYDNGTIIQRAFIEEVRPQHYKDVEVETFFNFSKPCIEKISWEQRYYNKSKRTSASKSVIQLTARPPGFNSILKIISKNSLNFKKPSGGDNWRFIIKSKNISMVKYPRDKNNGEYEVVFKFPKKDLYNITIVLDYSMCDGIRDPPMDWFTKGTVQGKFQIEGSLGHVDELLNEEAANFQVNFSKTGDNLRSIILKNGEREKLQDNPRCTLITKSDGYWRGNEFIGSSQETNTKPINLKRSIMNKHNMLMIYGDSMAKRFHKSLLNKTLCQDIFKYCNLTYTWTYTKGKHDTEHNDINKYDGKDFNETIFINDIKDVLTTQQMKRNDSVLIINFGLHVLMALQFERVKHMLEGLINLITEIKKELKYDFPLIIWKTTTPPYLETINHFKRLTHTRFMTKPRMHLWNLYATERLCKVGVDILDVHGMALSNPHGPLDLVHFNDEVFAPAEYDLTKHIIKKLNFRES